MVLISFEELGLAFQLVIKSVNSLYLLRHKIQLENLVHLCKNDRIFVQTIRLNFEEKVHGYEAENFDVFENDAANKVKSDVPRLAVLLDFENE